MTLGERLYSPSLILIHRNVLNMREGLSILYLAKSHLSIKSATYCFSALIHYLGGCMFGKINNHGCGGVSEFNKIYLKISTPLLNYNGLNI